MRRRVISPACSRLKPRLFAHAQFSAPETALTLGNPGDEFPYVKAMWHYARGIAHATRGAITEARTELETLASVAKQADFTDLIAGGVPVKEVVRIAQQVLAARIAQAEGDLKTTVLGFEAAVALEDGLPYMEPPLLVLSPAPVARSDIPARWRGRLGRGGLPRVSCTQPE